MKETYEIGPGKTVTITVSVDDAPSFRPNELDVAVGTLRVREDQAADLQAEVTRLETALAKSRELVALKDKVAEVSHAQRNRLLDEVRELTTRVDNLRRDRNIERDRANANKEWAERAEQAVARLDQELGRRTEERDDREAARARLEMDLDKARTLNATQGAEHDRRIGEVRHLLAEATKDRDRLAAQIGKVNGAVHSSLILSALKMSWESWTGLEAVALANAVRDVRRAIGSPGPDTSQA